MSDFGATASSRCPRVSSATGWKSLSDVVGHLRDHVRADRQRADRAHAERVAVGRGLRHESRPMVKAAPGLFSMMIFWSRTVRARPPAMRATVSVALPGACGTISRIGLSGNCPARTQRPATSTPRNASNSRKHRDAQLDDAVIALPRLLSCGKRSQRAAASAMRDARSALAQPRRRSAPPPRASRPPSRRSRSG